MPDRELKLLPGGPMLAALLVGVPLLALLLGGAATALGPPLAAGVVALLGVGWVVSLFGFVVNGPNSSRVVQLFGRYAGTLSDTGFFWGNPFYATTRVSRRVRTFETGTQHTDEVKDAAGKVVAAATSSRRPSKVNDRDGTPLEIAAVVTWRVTSPAAAVFTVDRYDDFVHVQSEAALRNLASRYRYDGREEDGFSLRGHIDEVAAQLKADVQERAAAAGVEVVEARISHLAYAPEVAGMMLQRQQAAATVAARRLIVDAAVGMVEHALTDLASKGLVDLDPERRAAMVSNLMVVLCSHQSAQPVVNAGTLYQ